MSLDGSEHGEELSEGALMWIRAMDRMREMKYVRGKDIRSVPRVGIMIKTPERNLKH